MKREIVRRLRFRFKSVLSRNSVDESDDSPMVGSFGRFGITNFEREWNFARHTLF